MMAATSVRRAGTAALAALLVAAQLAEPTLGSQTSSCSKLTGVVTAPFAVLLVAVHLTNPVLGSQASCSKLAYAFADDNSHNFLDDIDGSLHNETLFDFEKGCAPTQRCLFFNDAEYISLAGFAHTLWNQQTNTFSPYSPTSANEALQFANLVYDDATNFHINGVGDYKGPVDIGNYLIVPAPHVSGLGHSGMLQTQFMIASIADQSLKVGFSKMELWHHLIPAAIRTTTTRAQFEKELRIFKAGNSSVSTLLKSDLVLDQKVGKALQEHKTAAFLGIQDDPTLVLKMQEFGQSTIWKTSTNFYPCSAQAQTLVTEFPSFTNVAFSGSARQVNTVKDMCEQVQSKCTGEYQQFADVSECKAYYELLPHHDPKCVEKYGPYTAKGESLMCKYLHQFMVEGQPELHCFHAGPGQPDVNGKKGCSPSQCDPSESRPSRFEPWSQVQVGMSAKVNLEETCTDNNLEELSVAVLSALPFCLPSLNGIGCSSTNCSMAINTYLGRFVANGVVCKCKDTVLPSKVLQHLNIDPSVLLSVCAGAKGLVEMPDCLERRDHKCDMNPTTYVTKTGCREWVWEGFESAVMDEWSYQAWLNGRVTTSDTISSQECLVFQKLLPTQVHFSVEAHADLYIANWFERQQSADDSIEANRESTSIYVHPSRAPVVTKYSDVVSAMRSKQRRRQHAPDVPASFCLTGTFSQTTAIFTPVMPMPFNTGTPEHLSRRKLVGLVLPGLYANSDIPAIDHVTFNPGDENDIRDHLAAHSLATLYGLDLDATGNGWDDTVSGFVALSRFGALPDYVQRANGYTPGLAFIARWHAFADHFRLHLQDRFNVTRLRTIFDEAGVLHTSLSTSDMYKAFTGLGLTAVSVTSVAVAMIQMVQKNPCEMVPLFRASPESFILEFTRWHNQGELGFTADSNEDSSDPFEPSFHSIRAANLDKSIFPNPLEFDPSRPNLDQVISFNVLEEDFANADKDSFGRPVNHPPVTTLHRVCPARKFVPRYLEKVLPHFFPEVDGGQCSNGNSVVHGVAYTTEETRVQLDDENGSNSTVFVRKSEIGDSEKSLVIALHGYPFTPVETSTFCSQLRKRPSMKRMSCWAPELPGMSPSGRSGECTFQAAGRIIAALVRGASSSRKWSKVYLLGDGIGGTIAWSAAKELSKDDLEGLIVINAAHPEIMMGGLAKEQPSWKSVPFGPMLMPLVNPIINSAKYLDEKFEEYSWWTTPIRTEYKGRVEDIGPARMACYYTNNFKVESGIVTPDDLPSYRNIDPESHILMIVGGAGAPSKIEMEYTLAKIKQKRGRLVQLHSVLDAPRAMTLLQEPDDVDEVAERVSQFIRQTRVIKASAWNSYYPPITVTGGFVELHGYTASIPFCAFYVILLMMFGFALELYIGPFLLLEAIGREEQQANKSNHVHFAGHIMGTQASGLHHGAKIAMAPMVIAASASREWWAGLLFVFGLFHCGFPEVSSTLMVAYVGSPFVTKDTDDEGDDNVDDEAARKLDAPLMLLRAVGHFRHHRHGTAAAIEASRKKKERAIQQGRGGHAFNTKMEVKFRVMFFLNGLAYLMHHCGAIIVHTSICAHHIELELVTMVLIANALQHATCFIQFTHPNAFTVLVVALEVWMDIETWMVLPILPVFTQIGGYLIVLSHWLWISCGIINIVLRHRETTLFDLDGDGKIDVDEQVALDRHKAMTLTKAENMFVVQVDEEEMQFLQRRRTIARFSNESDESSPNNSGSAGVVSAARTSRPKKNNNVAPAVEAAVPDITPKAVVLI